MNKELLINLGLTEDESTIYNVLIDGGYMPARVISIKSNIGRPLTYKILDDLIIKKIVEKKEVGKKISLFSPVHPRELEKLLEKKKNDIEQTKKALDESIGQMVSKYNLSIGKPNVQFFEGIEGIQKVYEDLLAEKNDILLIQSPFDADLPELKSIILKQIEKQVANNIHTRVITPLIEITKDWIHKDEENLVTRCIVPEKTFEIPAQIIIYGNKIGISSIKKPFITTIIEDANICDSFKIIFEYIWKVSQEKHEEIIGSLHRQ